MGDGGLLVEAQAAAAQRPHFRRAALPLPGRTHQQALACPPCCRVAAGNANKLAGKPTSVSTSVCCFLRAPCRSHSLNSHGLHSEVRHKATQAATFLNPAPTASRRRVPGAHEGIMSRHSASFISTAAKMLHRRTSLLVIITRKLIDEHEYDSHCYQS
jgi:hypothetical protein